MHRKQRTWKSGIARHIKVFERILCRYFLFRDHATLPHYSTTDTVKTFRISTGFYHIFHAWGACSIASRAHCTEDEWSPAMVLKLGAAQKRITFRWAKCGNEQGGSRLSSTKVTSGTRMWFTDYSWVTHPTHLITNVFYQCTFRNFKLRWLNPTAFVVDKNK